MPGSLLNRHATVHQGAFLPHWTHDGAIYHTVFRLADSLPSSVVERYRRERETMLTAAEAKDQLTAALHDRLYLLFSERIEHFLDAGHGACWMRGPAIAELVAQALQHFDGQRYRLHAWCVMPNHVHAVVQPLPGHELAAVLQAWKGFTAHAANRLVNRRGIFWQKESYDHIVRDETELQRTIKYVQENPVVAGLAHWRWVWPKP